MKLSKVASNMAQWVRQAAEAVNLIDDGKIASTGYVRLANSTTSTTVTDRRVGRDSVILLMPINADGATSFVSGTTYIPSAGIDPQAGTFNISHANSGSADRRFRYVILGREIS